MLNKEKFTPTVMVGIISNILAIVIAGGSIWKSIESHIEDITTHQTQIIATMIANDLRTRLNLYESYVSDLEHNGEKVPTLLIYNIKALEDQLDDLKQWDMKNV